MMLWCNQNKQSSSAATKNSSVQDLHESCEAVVDTQQKGRNTKYSHQSPAESSETYWDLFKTLG